MLGILGLTVCLLICPPAVIAAMVLFGAGFGAGQNSTQTLMYQRAPAGATGTVSAMWNVAYDAGWASAAPVSGVSPRTAATRSRSASPQH